jgi:hypothetical protein
MQSATTPESGDDSDATGPPEETPERETETRQEADATDWTREEKPEQPETPQRNTLADEMAAQVAQDVAVLKPDDGCATPPPPPAHDSEVSNDNGSSPHRENSKPPAGATGKRPDMAAVKSRPLAFRSFSWDKKGRRSVEEAPPAGRVSSTGEHRQPADGKAWEEAGAEHKEKGKARWKRLWK